MIAYTWTSGSPHALTCDVHSGERCSCRLRSRLSTAELIELIQPVPVPVDLEQNREAS